MNERLKKHAQRENPESSAPKTETIDEALAHEFIPTKNEIDTLTDLHHLVTRHLQGEPVDSDALAHAHENIKGTESFAVISKYASGEVPTIEQLSAESQPKVRNAVRRYTYAVIRLKQLEVLTVGATRDLSHLITDTAASCQSAYDELIHTLAQTAETSAISHEGTATRDWAVAADIQHQLNTLGDTTLLAV